MAVKAPSATSSDAGAEGCGDEEVEATRCLYGCRQTRWVASLHMFNDVPPLLPPTFFQSCLAMCFNLPFQFYVSCTSSNPCFAQITFQLMLCQCEPSTDA
jgi:hypothetical protein